MHGFFAIYSANPCFLVLSTNKKLKKLVPVRSPDLVRFKHRASH